MIKLKSLLSEIYNTVNFWMDSNGKMIPVKSHIDYVLEHLDKDHTISIDDHDLPILPDGSIADVDDIYLIAFKQNYIRLVIEGKTLFFSYEYGGQQPNNVQKREMRDFAIENNLKVEDATTGRDTDF